MTYEHREYIDLNKIVDEQARRMGQMVDAATLRRLAPTLNTFGWYKRETCHDKGYINDGEWYFVCSDCGCEFEYTDFACEFADGRKLGSPNFCPNCGAKVIKSG